MIAVLKLIKIELYSHHPVPITLNPAPTCHISLFACILIKTNLVIKHVMDVINHGLGLVKVCIMRLTRGVACNGQDAHTADVQVRGRHPRGGIKC